MPSECTNKNAPVTHPQFAQACEIVRHANEAPMNHDVGVFCQPDYLAFNRRADGCIEFVQLRPGLETYFDAKPVVSCQ
jgi:hypothetical protein